MALRILHFLPKQCVCTLFVAFLIIKPTFANMWVDEGAPSSFEQLEAPHLTSVTLHYGGDLLGTFPAHITPSHLQFDDPGAIVALIPAIIDKSTIRSTLASFMPIHAELLCGQRQPENCGHLTPSIAGVIFDESNLNAELFINKEYLSITNDDALRYLPKPPQQFSSIYAFSGAATGTQAQNSSFSLTNDSIFAYGERKLSTQSTISNEGLRFDTMAASIERDGMEAQGGLFRSQPLQLLSDVDMAGVSLSTSMHTVLDTHHNEGNTVIVYLPRRAFVSIYREGRLYSSRAYEAGNQRIDTSDLPEGAYNITLRIQEADGSVREEKRFFAKNQGMPSPDFPTYYLQAGVVRMPASTDSALPDITSIPIVGAGTVQRIGDNLGLGVSLLGVQDRVAMEAGAFWLYNDSQIHMTTLSSTHGDYGIQASYQQNSKNMGLALDVRKTWTSDSVPTVTTSVSAPETTLQEIFSGLTQGTATLSYMLTPDVTVGARASYSQPQGSITTTSAGPYASWHIWQQGESMLELTADAARVAGHNEGSVLVHFSYKMGKYGVTGSSGIGYGDSSSGPTGNVRLWQDEKTADDELLAGANISADRNNQTVSADGDWHNQTGQVRGSVQETFGRNGSAFGYGGNFSVNAAQLENEVHLGGDQNSHSAVVIATEGDNTAPMKIMVNNTVQSTVKVGQNQVVYLAPYHTYNIRLISGQDGLLDYDVGEHPVTLYPGNVVRLNWKINTFYVVAARIVTPQHQLLAGALLQGVRAQTTTDDKGYLQAELSQPSVLTFTTADNATCQVHLPTNIKSANGVLIYREALPCVPVTKIAYK